MRHTKNILTGKYLHCICTLYIVQQLLWYLSLYHWYYISRPSICTVSCLVGLEIVEWTSPLVWFAGMSAGSRSKIIYLRTLDTTVIKFRKFPLFHKESLDIFIFRATAGSKKNKFWEFSSEIKGFITVEWFFLFNEADG